MARTILFHGDYFMDFYKTLDDKTKEKVKYVLSINLIYIVYFAVLIKVNWWFYSMAFKRKPKELQRKC